MKCISRSTILLVSAAAIAAAECVVVEGAQVRAGELAARVAPFAALDPQHDLGPSPFGAMVRIYSKTQLVEMLGRGAENLPETLCVERRREPIPESKWREALDRAVAGCEVHFHLREFPKHRFPIGELQFAKTGIVLGATVSLWRGSLALPDKQSIPVWVRAEIRVPNKRWKIAAPVPAGSRIGEGDVLQEAGWFAGTPCQAVEEWNPEGLIARRSLKPGAILQRSDARRPHAIQRGQTVDIESGGAARVRVPGVAETNAEIGQNVRVTSSWNGSRLTGRVTVDGKVRVE